jgi:hypothetical protein
MKNRLLISLLILTAIFGLTNCAHIGSTAANPIVPGGESEPQYIGPVAGYNKSLHSVDLASFAKEPLCPFFDNGDGNGFYLGGSYEYHIGNIVNSRHSIIARVLYNTMPASFTRQTNDNYPSILANTTTPIYTKTYNTLDVNYQMLTIETMYKFNIFENFGLGVTVGPTFDFAFSKKLTQKFVLDAPLNVQFIPVDKRLWDSLGIVGYENSNRTVVVKDGDIQGSSSFRLGIKAGLQYEIMLKGFYIVPSMYYNFGVTKLSTADNWRVDAFQAGVDVRFAL